MQTTVITPEIADRVNRMEESATLAMTQKARELAAEGNNVISLSVGEPDFDTPTYVKDAAKKAIDEGWSSYSPVPGYPELRKAIVSKLKRDNGIDCTVDNIVVSTGAKQSLANVIMSVVNPADEVIILAPYWVSYSEMVNLAGGKSIIIESDISTDFTPSLDEIEGAITDKTKVIMFSSPSNPTGALYSKEYLEKLAALVSKHPNIIILADEIYEYINYVGGHESIATIPSVKDQVVTVNGFSKGFAMTGWRVGYICAPVWLAKATNKIQGQVTSGTCSIAQRASITAYEDVTNLEKCTSEMKEAYVRRRDLMVSLAKEIPGIEVNVPQGAFYIFPDVSSYFGKSTPNGDKIANASDLAMYILNTAYVATVTGAAFGSPNNIRISYAAADEKIVEAMNRIKECLSKLA
ncbi:MAG: pyridoxal phosphate-dependent aminotransferase [Cyclobacteriaceae bacterium]